MRSAKPGNHLNGCNWTFEWNGNQVVLIASPLPIIIERTNKRSTKYGDHNFLSLLCLRQRGESIYLAQLKEYRKILSLFCCSDVLCKLISLSVVLFLLCADWPFSGSPFDREPQGTLEGGFQIPETWLQALPVFFTPLPAELPRELARSLQCNTPYMLEKNLLKSKLCVHSSCSWQGDFLHMQVTFLGPVTHWAR